MFSIQSSLPLADPKIFCMVFFLLLTEGNFHLPSYLSPDARNLITAMLVVDPVKRITIPEITHHPFFTTDLPRYLTPLPNPGPVLGSLSSLVTPPKALDYEIIEGLGRIEEDVVEELSHRLAGVEKDDIWECLRRDDGVQGNAVKVAYLLLRDKGRLGKDRKSPDVALSCNLILNLTVSGTICGGRAGRPIGCYGCELEFARPPCSPHVNVINFLASKRFISCSSISRRWGPRRKSLRGRVQRRIR